MLTSLITFTAQVHTVPSLAAAIALEARQHSTIKEWQGALWVAALMMAFIYTFTTLRYNVYGGIAWHHNLLFVSALCLLAQWGACTVVRVSVH